MDNKKSLLFSILAVVLMGVIISGGSFAYFVWSSGINDRSMINVTIKQDGITMHIETEQKTMDGLRPTRNCNNANAYVDATVTVVNNTGAAAVPSLKLKVKVTKGGSGELTPAALSHIKYSVVNPGDSCDQIMTNDTKSTESTENQDLLFMNNSGSWTSQLSFQSVATDGSWSHIPSTGDDMFNNTTASIGKLTSSPAYLPRQYYLNDNSDASFKKEDVNGITFVAAPHATTTHQFRVYVWIDEEYTSVTIGDVLTDPLQNAQIEINFSEQSVIQQVSSDSIGGEATVAKEAGLYGSIYFYDYELDEYVYGEETFISWDDLNRQGYISVDGTTLTNVVGLMYDGIGIIGELVILDEITAIGDLAFEFSDLSKVTFGPNSKLISVGDSAFDNCYFGIIKLPDSVTSVGNYAFSYNNLTESPFGENSRLESIGSGAFVESGLSPSDITLPVSLKRIDSGIFVLEDGNYSHSISDDEIRYNGTMAQWNQIQLADNWNYLGWESETYEDENGYWIDDYTYFYIKRVICSDGTIDLPQG